MRERVEDIGRLCEMLSRIMEHKVFEEVGIRYNSNNKFTEKYCDPEELQMLVIGMEDLKYQLSECWSLARWGDNQD